MNRPDGSNQVNATTNSAFDIDPSWGGIVPDADGTACRALLQLLRLPLIPTKPTTTTTASERVRRADRTPTDKGSAERRLGDL